MDMATDDLFQKALECDRRKDGFGLEEALRASALADLRNGMFNDDIKDYFGRKGTAYAIPDFSAMDDGDLRDAYLDILRDVLDALFRETPGCAGMVSKPSREGIIRYLGYLPVTRFDVPEESWIAELMSAVSCAFLPPKHESYKVRDRKTGKLRAITNEEYSAMYYDSEGLHEDVVFDPPRANQRPAQASS